MGWWNALSSTRWETSLRLRRLKSSPSAITLTVFGAFAQATAPKGEADPPPVD
jgi:hypothetical protein